VNRVRQAGADFTVTGERTGLFVIALAPGNWLAAAGTMTRSKRFVVILAAAMMTMATGAIAQSSAPSGDQALYDRGIASMERGDYAAARMSWNVLANTYADSAYLAPAKLAIAVSWLRQGDERALAQAEAEYKDFILFYPNMKEAADLQVGEPLRKIREQKAVKPR
jgi:TolA-binding protein